MLSDQEKSSFHLERPDTPANKKHAEMRIVENNSVSQLVAWCGAFAFACSLVLASTFKRSKKIISPKKSQDRDSDLDVGGFRESTTQDADEKARKMEGLQLLLDQSSSSDIISRSCHTTWKTLVKYTSIEDSEDENRPLTTEPILVKKEDENIVVIIYEEEEYPNSKKSIETETKKYDEISSKFAESFSSKAFDETWLAEWKYKPSTSTSSSSSSTSSEETSSSGILLQEIDGDDKNIDIVIYIDDDDEDGEDKHVHRI